LIEAWASMKSVRRKDGSGEPPGPARNGERDVRKETRLIETHASTTDPDARLYRKADRQESRQCFMGHALMENRHGLVVDAAHATGTAEREAALLMLDRRKRRHRITLGADKAYDVEAFVPALRARRVSPHVAINGAVSKTGKIRKTALDGRTTHHAGYAISLRCRKRIEEAFGWIKAQAGLRKVKLRGASQGRSALHLRDRRRQLRAVAQTDGPDGHLTGTNPPPGRARELAHRRSTSRAPTTKIIFLNARTTLLQQPASALTH
jgi:hypothetical protein